MAQGLMGLQNLLGQSSNAQQQSGLLGGGVFSQPESRGQRRSRLLNEAIAGAGQNPYARLGASFGGLIGMGGRAAAEGLGIVDAPEEVQQSDAIRQVQKEVADRGLDPMSAPREFGDFVAGRFQELGQPQLATRSLLQARQIESQFAPQQPELPAAAQNLAFRAQQAGLEPGTEEWEQFFLSGGTQRAPTQTNQQIQYYQSQGMTEREAKDLAFGQIQLDPSGRLVNISGGPVPDRVPDEYTPPPLGSVSEADTTVEPTAETDTTVESTAEEPQGMLESPMLTGFLPFVKRGFEGVAGQFSDSAHYPELNRYKTRLRSTERQLVSAWATSSRPPLLEQEKLAELFPGLGPLQSPRAARVKLEELGEVLLNQREADLQDLNDPEMSPSLRTEIQKRINATERTLRLLDPEATERGSITTFDQMTPEQAQSVLSDAIRDNTIPSSATLSAYDSERGGFYILDGGEIVRDPNGNPYFIDQGN